MLLFSHGRRSDDGKEKKRNIGVYGDAARNRAPAGGTSGFGADNIRSYK